MQRSNNRQEEKNEEKFNTGTQDIMLLVRVELYLLPENEQNSFLINSNFTSNTVDGLNIFVFNSSIIWGIVSMFSSVIVAALRPEVFPFYVLPVSLNLWMSQKFPDWWDPAVRDVRILIPEPSPPEVVLPSLPHWRIISDFCAFVNSSSGSAIIWKINLSGV